MHTYRILLIRMAKYKKSERGKHFNLFPLHQKLLDFLQCIYLNKVETI